MRALLLLQQGAFEFVDARVLVDEALVKHTNLLLILLPCKHEFLPAHSRLQLVIKLLALGCECVQVALPVLVLTLCLLQRRDPNLLL